VCSSDLGQPAGYSVLLCAGVAQAIANKLQMTDLLATFHAVDATDRFDKVASGEVDLLCGAATITLSRRELVDFSVPTYVDGTAVMLPKDASDELGDLVGKKIGVRSGTTTLDALNNTIASLGVEAEVIRFADHRAGLAAMISGEIDAYFSGGTYTVSAIRLEGENQFYHVAPESGPADGKGAINWIELNSVVNNPSLHEQAFDWMEYILQPETSYYVATAGGFLLPVGQMSQPDLINRFSKDELNAFQWDEFDYRIASSVEYDVVPDYNRLYDIYTAALREKS